MNIETGLEQSQAAFYTLTGVMFFGTGMMWYWLLRLGRRRKIW